MMEAETKGSIMITRARTLEAAVVIEHVIQNVEFSIYN